MYSINDEQNVILTLENLTKKVYTIEEIFNYHNKRYSNNKLDNYHNKRYSNNKLDIKAFRKILNNLKYIRNFQVIGNRKSSNEVYFLDESDKRKNTNSSKNFINRNF